MDAVCGDRFPGEPTGGIEQDRAWPRTGAADKRGKAIASNAVPNRVVHASYHATLAELDSPGSLEPIITAGERIKREKVGPLETEYADTADMDPVQSMTPVLTAIEELLEPLLRTSADIPAIFWWCDVAKFDYGRSKATAARLIKRYGQQGAIRRTTMTGGDPWNRLERTITRAPSS
ncbi:DnaT-like ssDNA-binding protein [Chelativorans salis]|uniref:Putative DnaT-like domain-containing protein n=1 Tax=Chelativorans salis TaxID=2978478 RepID=A0ABT2LQI2_9HYPH|nr:DnaT-like ssDNA-binding protein [Chelativorans sp. EGI FJ00035]MCT7376810.1 hypothetical protein [Chelativorans sp. EGI FJ00035]